VAELVRAAVEEGDVRPDLDPRLTSRLIFGLVNSVSEWYRPTGEAAAASESNGAGADGGQDIAKALTILVFEGLRRRD
jgi:hypothetical protein